MALADDDNYRERRYFTAWTKIKTVEDYTLPVFMQEIINQVSRILIRWFSCSQVIIFSINFRQPFHLGMELFKH